MRRRFIKCLNRIFGVFVLRLIWLFATIGKRLSSKNHPDKIQNPDYKNILVIKIVGLGDTVLMLPSIKRIKKFCPHARICALTTPFSNGILKYQPFIDEVITYDIFGKHKGLIGLLKIILELRKRNIDLVVDYEQHIKLITLVSHFTRAKRIIGFNNPKLRRDYLLTDSVLLDGNQHMVESFDRLISPLGFNVRTEVLERIQASAKDIIYVNTWLKEQSVSKNDLVIGIHAGSGKSAVARRWQKEKFAQIADRLNRKYQAKVVFTGSPDEQLLVKSITNLMENEPLIATGGLSITQLAVLIDRFDLFISNDTGPMHMAPAMGTLTIALFGPQDPKRYGPIGSEHIAIYKRVPCSPCINVHHGQVTGCKNPHYAECMQRITTDDVWRAVELQLSKLEKLRITPLA